jgi:hypothetical protein
MPKSVSNIFHVYFSLLTLHFVPGTGQKINPTGNQCSEPQIIVCEDHTGVDGSRDMLPQRNGLNEYKEQLIQLEKSFKQELQRLKSGIN